MSIPSKKKQPDFLNSVHIFCIIPIFKSGLPVLKSKSQPGTKSGPSGQTENCSLNYGKEKKHYEKD